MLASKQKSSFPKERAGSHGVGLCQVGAYGMALRGATYREILAHYYRGATLDQVGATGARGAAGGR